MCVYESYFCSLIRPSPAAKMASNLRNRRDMPLMQTCYTIAIVTLIFSWKFGHHILFCTCRSNMQILQQSFDPIQLRCGYTILPSIPRVDQNSVWPRTDEVRVCALKGKCGGVLPHNPDNLLGECASYKCQYLQRIRLLRDKHTTYVPSLTTPPQLVAWVFPWRKS